MFCLLLYCRSPSWPVWAPRLPPLPSSTAPPSPKNSLIIRHKTTTPHHSKLQMCNGFHSQKKLTAAPLLKSLTSPSFPRPSCDDEIPVTTTTLRLPPPSNNPSKSFSSPGILHSPSVTRWSYAASLVETSAVTQR